MTFNMGEEEKNVQFNVILYFHSQHFYQESLVFYFKVTNWLILTQILSEYNLYNQTMTSVTLKLF